MARSYTTTLSLSVGGDEPTWEGEATVTFSVTWGTPERAPAYSHGGLPADPDEINDITVTHIDGEPVERRTYGKLEAETLETHIECSDALMHELLTYAVEEAAADHADAMEYRAEQRRDDLLTGDL